MVTRVGTLKSEPVPPRSVDDGFLSDEEWGGVNEAAVTRDGTAATAATTEAMTPQEYKKGLPRRHGSKQGIHPAGTVQS